MVATDAYLAPVRSVNFIKSNDVRDAESLARYIQQTVGVPWPTLKDMTVLRRSVNEFFQHYPDLDYLTLCRVADWCRSKKRRFARVWQVVPQFRWAYADGALPEVDQVRHTDVDVEDAIREAVAVETDDVWLDRLVCSQGRSLRREVLERWNQQRRPVLLSS